MIEVNQNVLKDLMHNVIRFSNLEKNLEQQEEYIERAVCNVDRTMHTILYHRVYCSGIVRGILWKELVRVLKSGIFNSTIHLIQITQYSSDS